MTHPYYSSCLTIDRLALAIRIGLEREERLAPQAIEVDLRFYFQRPVEGCHDDDGAFLCYGQVHELLTRMTREREYRLIEFLTLELYRAVRTLIAEAMPQEAEQIKLWLKVRKCRPPVAGLEGGAGFVYTDLPAGAYAVPVA